MSPEKVCKEKDYNYRVFHNKRARARARRIVYSRVYFNFLLIFIQIIVFILFLLRLRTYIKYYFFASILLSFFFMVYLVNSPGKNEFKIAWMLPLIVFPLFGIGAYVSYHINTGGRLTKKSLVAIIEKTKGMCHPSEDEQQLLAQYPEIKGLCNYMINCGGFYPYSGCKVDYYPCGEVLFPEFLEELKKAKKMILIEFFIIDFDESWQQVLNILIQKVNEGVKVYLLYDGLGSMMIATKAYTKYLNSKGINARIFLHLVPFFSSQLNNRDHRKIVVIDGTTAFTGGLNIKNEYFNYGKNRFAYWKDNFVKIQGEAVNAFTLMFLQNWNLNNKNEESYASYLIPNKKFQGEKGIVIPYGDDAYNHVDIAEDVYCYILNNAKTYVHITSPYLIVDNNVLFCLINAVRRGVEVSIVLPSVSDHYLAFCIGRIFVKTLIDNGINIYFYEKGFIHAKTFVCDDEIATVGSVNLDYRSFYHHFECGIIMYKVPAIAQIEKDYQDILKDSLLITQEEYKKVPKIQRFWGRLLKIFAPLM